MSHLAAIFDLDGTLLDTEEIYTEATQQIAGRYGGAFTAELKRTCMGGDSRRTASIVIDALRLPLQVDEFLKQRQAYLDEALSRAREMNGAAALVAQIVAAGLPVGLATSSTSPVCMQKLEGRQFTKALSVVVCGDDPEVDRGKPAPDIYLLAARRLARRPTDCIVFEDSKNGIEAALAAGMRVVAVIDPRFDVSVPDSNDVIAQVSSLAEVQLGDLGILDVSTLGGRVSR